MTSPARRTEIKCPKCGIVYETFIRDSINLRLGERWSKADIRRATSSVCPRCAHRTEHKALVVGKDGVWHICPQKD